MKIEFLRPGKIGVSRPWRDEFFCGRVVFGIRLDR